MATRPEELQPVLLAATRFEALCSRIASHSRAVATIGVGARTFDRRRWGPDQSFVLVGLAAGLLHCAQPGDVLIPDACLGADGMMRDFDRPIVDALRATCARKEIQFSSGSMLTSDTMVSVQDPPSVSVPVIGVEMEAAHVLARERRVAMIRVVLDCPAHPVSPDWQFGLRAAARSPSGLAELAWLATHAPRFAIQAAALAAASAESTG
jgi:hypothetical protein